MQDEVLIDHSTCLVHFPLDPKPVDHMLTYNRSLAREYQQVVHKWCRSGDT